MKNFLLILSMLILTTKSFACDHFDFKNEKNIQNLMGKKSKFYDAYRQGKCVLENALEPLSAEQKKIIANLIAKTYTDK